MKKILNFIHSLQNGGAERQLCLLANAMANKKEYELRVACVNPDGRKNYIHQECVDISPTRRLWSLSYWHFVYNRIRHFAPDIVHIWLPASVAIPALLSAFILQKKILYSYRGEMRFHRPLVVVEFFLVLLFSHRIVSNHDIAGSNWAYRLLFRLKKGVVIENCVDVPSEYVREAGVIPQNRSALRFVYVGRLSVRKNPLGMIEGFSKCRNVQGWHLDVYGEGEQRREVESLLEYYELIDRVFLHGFSPEVYRHISEADVLIFPSVSEGMPNILLESFQIGTPTIASDIHASRCVVGNRPAVIWFDPHVSDTLSAAIKKILSNEYDLEQIVCEGKKIAADYSVNMMSSNYSSLYADMAPK